MSAHPDSDAKVRQERVDSAKTPRIEFRYLPIDQIKESEECFRLDMGEIDTLAESMSVTEYIDPLAVTCKDGQFEIGDGRRRLEAYRKLGWNEVPVLIFYDLDDIGIKLIQIAANGNRKDFTCSELWNIIKAFKPIISENCRGRNGRMNNSSEKYAGIPGKTMRLIGNIVGKSEPTLFRLESVMLAVERDPKTYGHIARRLDNEEIGILTAYNELRFLQMGQQMVGGVGHCSAETHFESERLIESDTISDDSIQSSTDEACAHDLVNEMEGIENLAQNNLSGPMIEEAVGQSDSEPQPVEPGEFTSKPVECDELSGDSTPDQGDQTNIIKEMYKDKKLIGQLRLKLEGFASENENLKLQNEQLKAEIDHLQAVIEHLQPQNQV
ncbi:MAG: ParB N-terminal domain-containing protein [Deltaproteobacteria bacterium]|nr:ParB N-terminal domain-containing protein [Deltaproteobacteria bacterium]